MTIPLACSCGRSFRIKDALTGRKIRCPDCASVLEVPLTNESRDVDKEALDMLLTDSPEDEPATQTEEREETPEPPPLPKPIQKSASTLAPLKATRPKAPPQKSERGPRIVFEEGWFGSLNAGLIGGLLMMLIAVVWFVLGLVAGRIFIYPPILLVIGLIAAIRGLLRRE